MNTNDSRTGPNSALHLLWHGELCFIVLPGGRTMEASWDQPQRQFLVSDGDSAEAISSDDVAEWWRASAKY
ncbi:hypothetical protein E4K72_09075 [Oxalobacteraceae bacterium OM1]|nr:hypothetical protein E4K72_09075 [Oxalobacteraceae bacterium OM1]